MLIKFKMPIRQFDPARTYDLDAPVADVYIRRGLAVSLETAAVEPREETRDVAPKKVKK